MEIGIAIVGTWLLVVILHALYYQGNQYRLESLKYKNQSACNLGYKDPFTDVMRVMDYRQLHIREVNGETIIDRYMINRMHYQEEQKFMERIKVDLVRKMAMELLTMGAVKFEERMDMDNHDRFMMDLHGGKLITAKLLVGIEQH
jgi:hypothetical protein